MGRCRASKGLALLVALGASAGCATGPKLLIPVSEGDFASTAPLVKPRAAASAGSETATAPTPLPSRCGETIPGWNAFARPGRVVMLGDIYGSNEIPKFVGDAACLAAEKGISVKVGLEIARVEQIFVDAYLQSEGTAHDRAELLQMGIWHRPYEDGKSSVAIFDLIERVRVLRKAGLPLDIVLYDELGDPGSHKERRMAQTLADRWAQSPRDLFLVMTGNVHARTVVGVPWDPQFAPMAYHLSAAVPDLVSLDAHYDGGQTWGCRFSKWGRRIKCRESSVAQPNRVIREVDIPKGKDGHPFKRFAGIWGASAGDGFDGIFYVGKLTPAQPATEPGMARR